MPTDGAMHSISTYQEYPANQPFLHDNYRSSTKPVKAYPESNRQAVMSALRSLQDKIQQLELERSQAEQNLNTLAQETSRYRDILQDDQHTSRDILQDDQHTSPTRDANLSQHTTDNSSVHSGAELPGQLEAAENRCNLLEKQLDYMRRMVGNAEQDRTSAVRRLADLERQRDETTNMELKSQLGKVSDLERDYLKLTATQTLAENRIRELEEKLKEERHQRKIMQDKAVQLESTAESDRILISRTGGQPKKVVKKTRKKKVIQKPKAKMSQPQSSYPREHYRLNLAELPFVAGKSTSPSYSVPANVQKVISLMKSHNPKLCQSPCSVSVQPSSRSARSCQSPVSSSRVSSQSEELIDLLRQLQDEFGHLSFEHQELSQQIQETVNNDVREDLERELDHLVSRMEAKAEQIAKLRRHRELLGTHKSQKKKKKSLSQGSSSRPTSAQASMPLNGEVEVTTTIRSKNRNCHTSSQVGSSGQVSLKFLKDLRTIQDKLNKDDLSWDDC